MITWNPDPVIFRIGPLAIRWYGLLFALAFLGGYYIMHRILKLEKKPIEYLDQLFIYVFIGTLVGARLGHCLFYDPGYYLSHPLEILQVWKGGLASHGAAIGILIALYFYAKPKKDISYLWILDRVVIVVALAGFFIRLGNLFNSEIYGKPTSLPWAFIFSRVDAQPRHPTQLYEALAYLGIFVLLYRLYLQKNIRRKNGFLFGLFLITVFGFRFLVEFLKEYQTPWEAKLPLDMGQILSIPLVVVGGIILYRTIKRKDRK